MKKPLFLFLMMVFLLVMPWTAEAAPQNQYVFDNAKLLTSQEVSDLQALAGKLGSVRETAFIVITVNGTDGKTLKQYVEDFYDQEAPGYDQPHGNAAILAIDMNERDVYLAGFAKAEQYLDNSTLDEIRNQITPDLTAGNYFQAFSAFIQASSDDMADQPAGDTGTSNGDTGTSSGDTGTQPGVNDYQSGGDFQTYPGDQPVNILFIWWFQLIVAVAAGGIITGIMVYRSGGRVTVNARTYLDSRNSRVLSQYDNYLRQTVTQVRKPQNNTTHGGGGGIPGGGGGGVTGGGSSHSGSGGKF